VRSNILRKRVEVSLYNRSNNIHRDGLCANVMRRFKIGNKNVYILYVTTLLIFKLDVHIKYDSADIFYERDEVLLCVRDDDVIHR
jgi:hypothetical protein